MPSRLPINIKQHVVSHLIRRTTHRLHLGEDISSLLIQRATAAAADESVICVSVRKNPIFLHGIDKGHDLAPRHEELTIDIENHIIGDESWLAAFFLHPPEHRNRLPVPPISGIRSDQRGIGVDVGSKALVLEGSEQGGGVRKAALSAEDTDDDGYDRAAAAGEEPRVAVGAAGPVEDFDCGFPLLVERQAFDDTKEIGEEGLDDEAAAGVGVGGGGQGSEDFIEIRMVIGEVEEGVEGVVAAEGDAGVYGPGLAAVGIVGPAEEGLPGGGRQPPATEGGGDG